MKTLADVYTSLKERFEKLKQQRPEGCPLFALEHGFNSEQLDEVKKILRSEISQHEGDIQRAFPIWHLPLLVIATEIGYKYQGNGTDYWLNLEKALEYSTITHHERRKIREWFEDTHKRFKIAKPLETPWSKQFRNIAWPITNAILPLDIRLQFMKSLALMPTKYYGLDVDAIATYLRRDTDTENSLRYSGWLSTMPSVGQLAQAIITNNTNESPFFSADTLLRLRQDMEQDKINGVKLIQLRNRIRENYSDSLKPIVRQKVGSPLPIIYGKLFLKQKENGTWILEAELPEKIACSLRENGEFKDSLRRGSLQLKAWNQLRIKPAFFLQRERLEIESTFWSDINSSFLQNPEFDDLKKIAFRFGFPIFFQDGKKIRTIESGSENVICVVERYADNVDGITVDSKSPNGFHILHIDTSDNTALDWCKGNGAIIREKRHWYWICPTGEIDDDILTVFQGDSFYLAIEEGHSITVTFQDETLENATGLFVFNKLELGEYSIDIDDEKWSVLVSKRESTPLFTADLQGEMIVDSLRNQSLMLNVASSQPFVNVDYSVSLSEESVLQTEYSDKFEYFPYRGGLFRQAFDEKNESELKTCFWQLIRRQNDLKICLEIGNVFKQEWTLESPCFGIWWKNTETENPTPESDGEEVVAEEVLHKAGRYPLYPDDVRLICAIKKENGERIYRATTISKYADTFTLGNVLKWPDRKLRQTKDMKNGIGLEHIVDSILAFRQAQSESLFAEMQRKKILDELETVFWTITCGEKWTEQANAVNDMNLQNELEQALKTLIREKLKWGTTVAKQQRNNLSDKILSDDELIIKCTEMSHDILELLPEFWTKLKQDTKDIEHRLSSKVFGTLKSLLEEKTSWTQLDGYIDYDDWNSFLGKFTEKLWGKQLSELVYPNEISRSLFKELPTEWSLKFTGAYVEKIQKQLKDNPFLQLWKPDIVKNVLSIFLNPAVFEGELKQDTLRAMLFDRQFMRCIAFILWRKHQYEKLLEVFGNA
ncbi:MAG: hypothetical protein ACRC2T_16305 [Thermoguttaceae bacterium]